MRITGLRALAALAVVSVAVPAKAQSFSYQDNNDLITATGGFGIAYFSANEFVYSGNRKLSQLIWEGYAPVASASVTSSFADGWNMTASGSLGAGGDHYMTDYDWVASFGYGTGFDEWTHRSQHPDTRLDHYLSASLRAGRYLMQSGNVKTGVHIEANYTDVQWTAYGGSGLYSSVTFRDTIPFFNEGEAAITYRQMFPMLLAGVDAEMEMDQITFSGMAQGGFTFLATANDDHWLRDLNFYDQFDMAPVLAAELKADYAFSEDAGIYASIGAKKIFEARGSTIVTDNGTGNAGFYGNAAGADFASVMGSIGLSGSF